MIIRKIDNYYRFAVPREMLRELGLEKGKEICIEQQGDKIILTAHKEEKANNDIILEEKINEPELILDEPDIKPEEVLLVQEEKKEKIDTLEKLDKLKNKDYGLKKYEPTDEISISKNSNFDYYTRCVRCRKAVFDSKFLLNNKPLCLSCFRDIKKQLREELFNG